MDYWVKVLAGAWGKTYQPLDWNRKKVGVVLLALGSFIAAGVQLGLAAMLTTATGLMWTAFPFVFAALILFVWGVIETQANLYSGLAETTAARIGALEAALVSYETPSPEYEPWRRVDEMKLQTAAQLWCEEIPSMAVTPKVRARLEALISAVKKGELEFVYKHEGYGNREELRKAAQLGAWSETTVTCSALKAYSKLHDYDPIFLRDS